MTPRVAAPAAPSARGRRVRSDLLSSTGWVLLLVVLAYLVVWPILQLVGQAFLGGGDGIRRMLEMDRLGTILWNTVRIGVSATLIALVLGTTLALCAARLTPRVRRVVSVLPLVPLIVPAAAMVVGWAFLLSPTVGYLNRLLRSTPFFDGQDGPFDIYSVPGIVMVLSFSLTAFVFLFVDTGLRNIGNDVHAAAAASGASERRILFTITLPLLRPAIVYAGSVALLLSFGTFTAPLFLGSNQGIRVITTEIFAQREQFPVDYPLTAALALPVLTLGIAIVGIQRILIRKQSRYVVAADRSRHPGRSRSSIGALVVIGLYSFWTTALPILALLHVSFSPFWTGTFSMDRLSLRHYRAVWFEDPRFLDAIRTTLGATTAAVIILLPLGFLCARAVQQRTRVPRGVRGALDTIVNLPLGISATLLGLGFLYTYTAPPFVLYNTIWVLVLVYVALMLPHAARLQLTTLIGLGHEATDASAAAGAGRLRTLRKVSLPMARKGLGAAAALMVILLFDEVSASLMVRSAQTNVLGTLMWDLWNFAVYPRIAVLALTMVALTLVGVLIALALAGREALERL